MEEIFKAILIIIDAGVIATTKNNIAKIAGFIAIMLLSISMIG